MKRFEGEDALTRAKNDVLERMSGCADENCHACASNNKAIETLVDVAQAAVPRRPSGLDEALNSGDGSYRP
jgi:hypothetical protein